MLSAWPAAAEAFERAITEDSDVALASRGGTRESGPTRHRARRAMSNRSSTQPAGSGTLPALIPAPHEKAGSATRPGFVVIRSGKATLGLVDDLGREIDELPYLMAGLLPGASGMRVVEDASTLVTARPEGNPTVTPRRQRLAVRHRQRCPPEQGH
jgi:hypothetical protein